MKEEEWKDVIGYENLYQISNYGNVKSLGNGGSNSKERIMKQGKSKNDYMQVVLCKEGKKKTFRIHKLVATAFIPNPDNLPILNHKDENKTNNCVSNLEWCSYQYNNTYGTKIERMSKANSIAQKGKKLSQETKDKIGKAQKGKILSQEHIEKLIKATSKPILQLSKSGNIILRKWDSLSQASELLKINCGKICECCKGKRKSAGKYKWVYLEDYVNKMNNYFNLAIKEVS